MILETRQRSSSSISSITSTPREREDNLPQVAASFKEAIISIFPKTYDEDGYNKVDDEASSKKATDLWDFIDLAYGNTSRNFHNKGHFSQLLEAGLYDKVVSGKIEGISREEQIQILIAAYHDAVYAIDEDGLIANIQGALGGNTCLFGSITNYLIEKKDYREDDISALAELFGIKEDTEFTVGNPFSDNKLDGAPMNEFLSALEAMQQLAPDGVEELTKPQQKALLEIIVGIQMTVPFKEEHAAHLFTRTQALLSDKNSPFAELELEDKEIAAMVNRSVDIANRDVGNFSQDTFLLKLLGDWSIQQEFDPANLANEEVSINELFRRVTNTGFEGLLKFKLSEHAVAQPKLALHDDGDPILRTEDDQPLLVAPNRKDDKKEEEEYLFTIQEENIAINIEASKISATVMGAALAMLYDHEEAIKIANKKSVKSRAKSVVTSTLTATNNIKAALGGKPPLAPPTHKILASLKGIQKEGAKRLIEALEDDRCELPENLKLVMLDLMKNHSLDKITKIKDSVVTKDEDGKVVGNTLTNKVCIEDKIESSQEAGKYLTRLKLLEACSLGNTPPPIEEEEEEEEEEVDTNQRAAQAKRREERKARNL